VAAGEDITVGVRARWAVAVVAAMAVFGGGWWGLETAVQMDAGVAVGVAAVPFAVVLAVLGAWSERAREKKAEAGRYARVAGSSLDRDIGQVAGEVNIGRGAVFHFVGERRGESRTLAEGGPVVAGDVPQEPAAFQPRAELAEALAGVGRPGPGVSVVFAVTGMRGVGKTQVAAAYARALIADRWRLVAWVDAGDAESVLAGLQTVAVAVGMSHKGEKSWEAAQEVRHWLEADGARCLVVFDNAVDLDGLREFLPAGGAAQVVITTTRRAAGGLGTAVPVDVFTMAEAVAFLAERTGMADEGGAREVATELGCLPLALAQAGALLRRESLGYGTYLGRLRALPVEAYLVQVEGDPYPHGMAGAALLSLAAAEDGDATGVCGAVMDLVAVLSASGVPRSVLHAAAVAGVVGREDSEGRKTARVPTMAVDAAVGQLSDASMLTFSLDGSAVVAHRLVMRVVRERRLAQGALADVAAAAVRLLSGLAYAMTWVWGDPTAARELARQIAALSEHVSPYIGISSAGLRDDLLALRIRGVWLLNQLGDSPGLAIRLCVPLAAECERALGTDHPVTLTSRSNLAYAYQRAGRLDEAIPVYEQVLADRERVLGADHPRTLASRNNLAGAYQSAGRLGEAIPRQEKALADRERVLGADHPDTLTSRSNRAYAYQAAGRLGEAISLYEQTLADCERVLGADHPHTLTSRNNLAGAYRAAGRLGEAISLYEQTLADCERVLGADHRDTLTSRSNLAGAYRAVGRLGEAISLYEQTLADCERVLGADHPDTLTSRHNRAYAYWAAGRLDEAISLYEHTIADRRRVLGADHPHTLTSRSNLAGAYQAAGRLDEALSLYEQILADRQRVLGADHPDTLTSRHNRATARSAMRHRHRRGRRYTLPVIRPQADSNRRGH
jgi:tetratricopeptide (TPR) repeat protein